MYKYLNYKNLTELKNLAMLMTFFSQCTYTTFKYNYVKYYEIQNYEKSI